MTRNRRISAAYTRELVKRYPKAVILDVRSESEYAAGHIPGAILLPDFEISGRANEVLCDYNALILVYCQSGARSRAATSLLVSMGYVNVYDFGGINSWPYEVE
ncbi:MAG: rhodanese-like domain-containing protein [Firmicutes bacterium]|nr:rhodanese-like domain-containing protein [Bacillota bacterium]